MAVDTNERKINNTGSSSSSMNFGAYKRTFNNATQYGVIANAILAVFKEHQIEGIKASVVGNVVAFHNEGASCNIVFAETNKTLQDIINGGKIDIDLLDHDAYDYIERLLPANTAQLRSIIVPVGVDTLDETVINRLAESIFNTLRIDSKLMTTPEMDINLQDSLKGAGNITMSIETLNDDAVDELGQPRRRNFRIRVLNSSAYGAYPNTTEEIVNVEGYIDIVPKVHIMNNQNGAPLDMVKFHPNIIINYINGAPSLGYALIGIAAATRLATDSNWVSSAVNMPNIGYLNRLKNIFGDKTPKAIELNGKISREDLGDIVLKLVDGEPFISIDMGIGGLGVPGTMALSTAAIMNSKGARQHIGGTLRHMTGAKNIPEVGIFSDVTVLPAGYYTEEGVRKGLDNIDSQYCLSNFSTGHEDLLDDLMDTEVSRNGDTFLKRIEFLDRLGINGVVLDRKVRGTFSMAFIRQVVDSLSNAGLVPYMPMGENLRRSKLGFTADHYNGAGVPDSSTFGRSGESQYRQSIHDAYRR